MAYDSLLLTLHLLTASLYFGTVFFWTFIIDTVRQEGVEEYFDEVETRFSQKTRAFMKINVALLLLSGIALILNRLDAMNHLLELKATLGIIVIGLFYVMPNLMKRFKNQTKAHDIAHLGMFGAIVVIIVLAKVLYL